MDKSEKAKIIEAKLRKEFPHVEVALNHNSVFELLIAAILSAQCTDKRVNETTNNLFQKYKNVSDFAEAKQVDLVEDISKISLRNNKSKNIIRLSNMLLEEHYGNVPDIMADLLKLPGVGRKTANIVLGEWYGKPAGFTVDTHVRRCAYRMGLTDSKDPKQIEKDLMNIFPKEKWVDTASRIIFHGRTTCPANRKADQPCSLGELCVVRE